MPTDLVPTFVPGQLVQSVEDAMATARCDSMRFGPCERPARWRARKFCGCPRDEGMLCNDHKQIWCADIRDMFGRRAVMPCCHAIIKPWLPEVVRL